MIADKATLQEAKNDIEHPLFYNTYAPKLEKPIKQIKSLISRGEISIPEYLMLLFVKYETGKEYGQNKQIFKDLVIKWNNYTSMEPGEDTFVRGFEKVEKGLAEEISRRINIVEERNITVRKNDGSDPTSMKLTTYSKIGSPTPK